LSLDRIRRRGRAPAAAALVIAGALIASGCSSSTPTAGASRATSTTSSTTTTVAVEPRPFAFTVQHVTFVDTSRTTETPGNAAYSPNRTLPTDVYIPTATTPRPLIMFSHGYHGAPRKFTQLFSAWARAGYAVAAPRFPLTSDRGQPYDVVADVANQPGDISFVLTQLLKGPLRSHIDAARVGAAGLSLGGGTTYNLIEDSCCRDPRIRAAGVFDAVHLSLSGHFQKNKIPLLITHIDSDLAVPYKTAQQAYAQSVSPKWFLTFHTGLHPEAYEDEPSVHDRTATKTSIDFFDLTLLGDTAARARLLRDGTNPGESTIVAG
jgi:predicted dienelactone hydrolase